MPDPAISNEGQTDINLVDEDMDRNQPQEGAHLGHGHQYTRVHATSNPSARSIPQSISSKPTAVQYQGESASRDTSKKLQKSGNAHEKASSQSSRTPAGIGGALSRKPYPCDICGKRYAQRQGVKRHYREIHGHPNSCSYCNFEWSRPYLYRDHLKTKHRDVVSDAAQDEATSTSYRVANTASPLQQQPVLTLTPERQRSGTETWRCPLTPPFAAVEVAPTCSPAAQRVDHEPRPLRSAEPTMRKRKRELEDTRESKLRTVDTELLSTEARSQLAKDLDMPVRKVQTWLVHALVCTSFVISDLSDTLPGLNMRGLPARVDMAATWLLGLLQMSHADPTYSHLALLLPTTMRSGNAQANML